ncbi:MAG TPA: ComEC/Rec2 family competence protein [Pyrinomonadaceae bacterium]|nr:ComEC/Rec2 family competence protein [Pyrinomonadaceae bacterium]
MRAQRGRLTLELCPLAMLAAAFAAGVACGRAPAPTTAWLVSAALVSTAALVITLTRAREAFATTLVVLAFLLTGATLSSVEAGRRDARGLKSFYERGLIESGDPVELTGVLERAPEEAPDGLVFTLRVERVLYRSEEHSATGRVELFAEAREPRARAAYAALELRRGARVRVLARPRREETFRNPGVASYVEYLEQRELDARASVKSHLLVERLDDESVFLPLAWLNDWRVALARYFARTFSRATAGVVNASMLGDRHGLTREVAERFRAGGTFHVLVISGLHVTFVGWLAFSLARRATRRRLWQWATSAACVWAYALAVGAESAVVRAALMFTAASLAPALGRRAGTANALGGAALALLIWRPRALFDPSFQLTFLSVVSIVALAWPLVARLKEVGEWRPTRATPYPPACPQWFRVLGETLFWRERRWREELARSTHSYALYKTSWAARLERFGLQRLARYATVVAVVSAGVQLGMLPLLVLYFHRVSFAALALNIMVGALMCVLSFAALAAFAASTVGLTTLESALVWLCETATRLMADGVEPFERLSIAGVRPAEYAGAGAVVYALYFVPLAALAFALLRWTPLANVTDASSSVSSSRPRALTLTTLASASLILIIVAHPLSAGRAGGRLRVDFLDVGQGDAALVTMPDGATLLVDGGGLVNFAGARAAGDAEGVETFERDAQGVGERVVSEYLWWRGLASVDYVAATHADADHVQGLADVLRNFRVRALLAARAPEGEAEFARVAEEARRRGVPVYLVGRGDRLSFGEATAEVLWPPRSPHPRGVRTRNDDSLVLRLSFGERCFLLTGDIERAAEAALVASGASLRCDVLKAAHHGSRTSSSEAFVAAARPRFVIVSAAKDSPYGHPHAEVVARWRSSGAEIISTAERGMVTVTTDGRDLRVETFVKE